MSDRLRATRIYVGNIRRNSRDSDLRRVFDQVGPMESFVYYGDDEAYIEFRRHEDADYAIRKFDGYSFEGRRLLVEWALLSLNRGRDRRDSRPSYRDSGFRDSSYRKDRMDEKKCYACGEVGHFQKDCRGGRRREEDSYVRRRRDSEEDYRRRDTRDSRDNRDNRDNRDFRDRDTRDMRDNRDNREDFRRREPRENSVQESRNKDQREERNSVRESVREESHKDQDPRLQQAE